LNWENQEVKDHLEDVLKFWLDRGVDGFRIDVAHGMVKEAGLPDVRHDPTAAMLGTDHKPFWDQEGVHDIYRDHGARFLIHIQEIAWGLPKHG
jgi:alpha-glucosidase